MSAVAESRPPLTHIGEVVGWRGEAHTPGTDTVAVEEPLEIRLAGLRIAVTMRTPGHDFDLALGFLFTEGIIRSAADIGSIAFCPTDDVESEDNIVNVNPVDHAIVDPGRWQRNFFTTSSCGICGKASIDSIRQDAAPIQSDLEVSSETLYRLDARLRAAQAVFEQTGGLHAAGLFDTSGHLLALREDVGRHNAVDKVIGHAVRDADTDAQPPLRDRVLVVSGRTSFEIVQKAWMAGIPIVAAVSAPSSLAVDLARTAGMTLVGFLRSGRFNVYAGAERIL
ncbi:MAG: formate dehydrogenase accessory sulfurtransferase FdhD [Chloroflexota bacterium]